MTGLLAIIFWSAVLGVGSESIQDPSLFQLQSGVGSNFNGEIDYKKCEGDCEPHQAYQSSQFELGVEYADHGHKDVGYEPLEHQFDNVEGNEPKIHDEYTVLNPSARDSFDDYVKSLEYGEFPVSRNEFEHPEETRVISPYFDVCQKIGLKFQEIDSLHPELRPLKLEFLKRLDFHASDLDIHEEGVSAVVKFLDLVVKIASQLKEESFEHKHKIHEPVEEIVAEEELEVDHVGFVGSIRGIPGVHYPNYTEVPITSFSCSDKKFIPGFYADLETGCQVFHVCYEHRRESFLCPLGTIFNQPILACDFWYSANCSQAPNYYDVNDKKEDVKEHVVFEKPHVPAEPVIKKEDLKEIVKFLPVKAKITEYSKEKDEVLVSKPIEVVPEIFKVAPKVISKPRKVHVPKIKPVVKRLPLVKTKPVKVIPFTKVISVPDAKIIAKAKVAAVKIPALKAKFAVSAALPIIKAKLVKSTVPIVKAKVIKTAAVPIVKTKVVAAAVPVTKAKIIKAKVASSALPIAKAKIVKAALPVFKSKLAAAVVPVKAKAIKAKVIASAVPVVKAKAVKAKVIASAVPVIKAKTVKAKVIASAVPVIKAKTIKAKVKLATVPIVKAKVLKAAAIPVIKSKAVPVFKTKKVAKFVKSAVKPKLVAPLKLKFAVAGIPVVKAKAAVISPLTKKALALGYMKLLKAKKLALG